MLAAIINFLIILLIVGLLYYLAVWVLGILGIAVPPRVMQIIGAIIVLLIILWFVQSFVSGGHGPSLWRL